MAIESCSIVAAGNSKMESVYIDKGVWLNAGNEEQEHHWSHSRKGPSSLIIRV